MKVELVPHTGIRFDDVQVEFQQWQVFAAGVLVGYLSHDANLPLMMLCNQPDNILQEVLAKCEAIVGRPIVSPYPIYEPPEIDNEAGEDNDNDESDEEDDNDDQ